MDVDWGLSRGSMEVKRHPRIENGVVLKMHCSTTVPLKLEVATRVYWRFFCLEHGELLDDGVVNVSTGTIARSFSLLLSFEDLTSKVLGKYTCQTHVKVTRSPLHG
ncbi:hypothetical protein V7S43_003802 [Phytophthora oleae]|uniref:Ig-like domain-containing protein n=1 Tax=Phytophthora oleae TaxID=2107226 RepID=A0ABD3FY64_9STRA